MMWSNDQPGLGIDVDEELAARYPFPEHPLNGAWPPVRLPRRPGARAWRLGDRGARGVGALPRPLGGGHPPLFIPPGSWESWESSPLPPGRGPLGARAPSRPLGGNTTPPRAPPPPRPPRRWFPAPRGLVPPAVFVQ